jgi:hypothetical protein
MTLQEMGNTGIIGFRHRTSRIFVCAEGRKRIKGAMQPHETSLYCPRVNRIPDGQDDLRQIGD